MKFLLDSNILIAVALASGDDVRQRMASLDEGDVVTSAVAYAEVVHGSVRGTPPALAHLQALVEEVLVLPFGDMAARAYATLSFRRASYDRLIAAHALSLGLTLVADNQQHFTDVPGLKVEKWLFR